MSDIIERIVFDDSAAIKSLRNILESVTELDIKFDQATGSIKEDSAKLSKALVDNSSRINAALKETVQVSNSFGNTQKTIGEVALAIAKNSTQSEKLLSVYKKLQEAKNNGIILDATDVDELTAGFNKLAKDVGLSQTQLDILLTNIDAVVKEVKKVSSQEFNSLANSATSVTQKLVNAKTELRALTNAINSGRLEGDELKEATKRAAELTDTIGDARDEITQLSSDTRNLDLLVEGVSGVATGFQLAEGAMQLMGDESADMQKSFIRLNAIMAIANGLQEAGAFLTRKGGVASLFSAGAQTVFSVAVGASSGALKIFRIALAATGIGLIVLLLGSLIANFSSVKKAITDVFPALNNLKSIFYGALNGIVAGFKGVNSVIAKALKGDFSRALDAAKNLGKDIGTAYNKGVTETIAKDAEKALAKSIEQTIENQKRRLSILEAQGKDTYALQKTILNNELQALKLHGKNTEEAKKEIADKQNEIDVLSAAKQKEKGDKTKELREKAIADLKSIKDDLFSLLKEYKVFGKLETFELVKNEQLNKLKLAKAEIEKLGKTLGKDVSPVVAYFDQLIKGLQARGFETTLGNLDELGSSATRFVETYKKEIAKLGDIEASFGIDLSKSKKNLEDKIKDSFSVKSLDPVKIKIPEIVLSSPDKISGLEKFTKDIADYLSNVDDFDGLFSKFLTDIFGDEEGEILGDSLNALQSFVSTLNDIANEAAEIQIEVLNKQIEDVQKRREKLQDGLAQEVEDQKLGLANSVGDKQKQIDALLAEEKRLVEEQDKIKKEAHLRQLRIDTATQAASLITTSIGILKGFSTIPIVGLPLGIAAVATMFAFFAKAKADAFKATKLYTSTEGKQIKDFMGFPARYGETDLPGRGEGYRLVDEKSGTPTNVIVSGREMILDEATSLANEPFFHSLRLGQYRGIDLQEAVGFYKQYKNKMAPSITGGQTILNQKNSARQQKQFVAIPYIDKKGKQKAVLYEISSDTKSGTVIEFE